MAEQKLIQASSKGLRLSPRKVSLVAALVRGRSVADALVILDHTPKRAAKPLAKLIASAKANATHNHSVREDSLQITKLQVTTGTRLKRYRPAAMGRALPYQKRTSHVLVEVAGEVKVKPAAKAPATKAAEKKETK
ncbi:MAG: 50S ribosomal protein L22 [Candidatus Saccharimonadales bacterium]